jgi:hypothetical protein
MMIVLAGVVTTVGTTFYLVIAEDAAAEEMTMFLVWKTIAEEDAIEEMTTFLVWETTAGNAVVEEMTMFVVQETIAEEDAETAAGSGNE